MKTARVITTENKIHIIEPNDGKRFTLAEMQHIVGGTIQIQHLPRTKEWMVMNDDGALIPLPMNEAAASVWLDNFPLEDFPVNNPGMIFGNVIVVSHLSLI